MARWSRVAPASDEVKTEEGGREEGDGFGAAAIAPDEERGGRGAEHDVQENVRDVEDGRGRKSGHVRGVQDSNEKQ